MKVPSRASTIVYRALTCGLAGVLLHAAPSHAQDAEMKGRLFTTPSTRAALDRVREEGPPPIETPVEEPSVTPVAVEPEPGPEVELPDMTVSGVVVRSGGRSSAWVNGRLVQDGSASFEGVRVHTRRDGRSVELVLPDSGQALRVRPGQRIAVRSGDVLESYEVGPDEGTSSVFDDSSQSGDPDAPASADSTEAVARSLIERTERTLGVVRTLGDLLNNVADTFGDGPR